jgi:ribosomal subunit interface protein
VDIVVKGRNVEVPDHYRQHVADKLAKVERYDHKIISVDVELFHEKNRRQSDNCQRIEITCFSRGPVVRAEACAADFYSALDAAITKLESRLRRAADRRRIHRGRRAPVSVAAATAPLAAPQMAAVGSVGGATERTTERTTDWVTNDSQDIDAWEVEDSQDDQPWRIVREKEHPGEPMTVEDALFHMELLGHDFYLFNDKESGRPSVVYRRRAYDYGVLSLNVNQ